MGCCIIEQSRQALSCFDFACEGIVAMALTFVKNVCCSAAGYTSRLCKLCVVVELATILSSCQLRWLRALHYWLCSRSLAFSHSQTLCRLLLGLLTGTLVTMYSHSGCLSFALF